MIGATIRTARKRHELRVEGREIQEKRCGSLIYRIGISGADPHDARVQMKSSPGAERHPNSGVPLWIKIAYTAFVAVLVPIYWANYGPSNFLYFCDIALFLTLVALWTENSLLASMAAVGIVLPQLFWCVDFAVGLAGRELTGMTTYMFDPAKPLHLRGLSLFHGWLPFLLLYLVARLRYDRRGLVAWTGLAWLLCLIAFFFLPPAGADLADPNIPINVNYVFGLHDATPQSWMPAGVYLIAWMLTLFVVFYLPTHLVLRRIFSANRRAIE